jgi:hypothetical protein
MSRDLQATNCPVYRLLRGLASFLVSAGAARFLPTLHRVWFDDAITTTVGAVCDHTLDNLQPRGRAKCPLLIYNIDRGWNALREGGRISNFWKNRSAFAGIQECRGFVVLWKIHWVLRMGRFEDRTE